MRLYAPSPLRPKTHERPPQLTVQLKANRLALDSGAPERMQQLFPEGFFFCHVFHGLTWIELALRDPELKQQAVAEATKCLDAIDSTEGREPFPRSLPPDHGMFYSAWKCHLLAGIVLLQDAQDAAQLNQLRTECDAIAASIRASKTPFLPSYVGSAWPCDTAPAIHALSAFDRITKSSRFGSTIKDWLKVCRSRMDAKTGLFGHTAALPEGRQVSVARATSQVIILRMLPDIDAAFAREQYERFRERFFSRFVGAPCVLEYPSGVTGRGDIDSGPLVFGHSISATVLMMGVAQIYGDHSFANAIAQAGEAIGLPWTWGGRKSYAGGLLPVGDIIVAYAHVARPWFEGHLHHPDAPHFVSFAWRLQIHLVSLVVLTPWVIAYLRNRRPRRTDIAGNDPQTDRNPNEAATT